MAMPQTQLYAMFPTPYPTPDTGNYAFDAQMTLPLFEVQGRGMFVKSALAAFQFGMVTNESVVKKTDYTNGGYVAGQYIGQPLSQSAQNTTG